MKIYTLQEVVSAAAQNSPFYRELYRDVVNPNFLQNPVLTELPLIDAKKFWQANRIAGNQLLTKTPDSWQGLVFKSGGSTGNPKFSLFTHEEWQTFTECFGQGMAKGWLSSNDRVANLFYVGELYASFLFIKDSIQNSGVPALQFPLAGATAMEEISKTLQEFEIETLAGVPTTIVQLATHMSETPKSWFAVKKILFGGESFFDDQIEFVQNIWPGVEVHSIGYASVDAGLLGYASRSGSRFDHHCFSSATIVEILDEESGRVITECGLPGKLIVTNLTRKLMPIIRYPAGDQAEWIDVEGSKDRRFRILGRSEEGARVGPVTVFYDDVQVFLTRHFHSAHIKGFQLVLTHEDGRDRLTIRCAVQKSEYFKIEDVLAAYEKDRPLIREAFLKGLIHPVRLQIVDVHELEANHRTGKMKRVIDLRSKS